MEIIEVPFPEAAREMSPTRLEGMEIRRKAMGFALGDESPTRLEGMEIKGRGAGRRQSKRVSDPP